MKNLLLLIFLFSITFSISAQDYYTNEQKGNSNPTKEEKKEQKQIEKAKQLERVTHIVESRRFVLEANFLSNQKGEKIPVHPNLNYILIDSLDAIIQVGSNYGIGSNGLGGITLDGNVSQYILKKNVKRNYYGIDIFVTALGGPCDIFITANPHGNATATVTGLFPGFLMFHGTIKAIRDSKVHKGKAF